jgi:hypothetical protein
MRWTLLPALLLTATIAFGDDRGLVGHWKLSGDANDSSGRGNHGRAFAVDLTASGPGGQPNSAARFDGKSSYIEVPSSPSISLGTADFTLAVQIHTEAALDDVVGDLASKFDPVLRRGFNLCVKSGTGTTISQANDRNLQFGIDSGTEPVWSDRGRPGNAVYVMAMAVHDGKLFVGTCEAGPGEAGHVYRYGGDSSWIDCGSPDRCNAVTSLAVHDGKLYAGTGRYRLAGSSLPESTNKAPGGKIVRYDGDGKWADCGRLPDVEMVGGMASFQGGLYAASLYKPAGFFKYRGGDSWERGPLPVDGHRVVGLSVFNDHLYAGSYDSCSVYRFDGKTWEDLGDLEPSGQTYSFEVHNGGLFVATWPYGRVFRLDRDSGGTRWVSAGRLGKELEVMGMAVHNGKLYGGTLPLAEVHRLDGDSSWTRTGQLDATPDVRYRRAWTMAVFKGELFCGTLPSGHVHSLDVGRNVSLDRALQPGWRHLAAIREGGRLSLFVDGKRVASSDAAPNTAPLDLTNDKPLRIGLGANDYFRGRLSDLRLYDRALSAGEIAAASARDDEKTRP